SAPSPLPIRHARVCRGRAAVEGSSARALDGLSPLLSGSAAVPDRSARAGNGARDEALAARAPARAGHEVGGQRPSIRPRLLALLFLPLLASGSHAAQAPVPPVAVAPDARTQQLWEGLVDPCQGVRNALVRQGRDPSQAVDADGTPVLETAWA